MAALDPSATHHRLSRQGMLMALAILFVALCLGSLGQVLLKAGINMLGVKPPVLVVLRSIFTNSRVFGGFACYALSSLFYIVALSRLPLSFVYPLIALTYVLVAFVAWAMLHESISGLRVAGLAVIMAGVVVMALSYSGAPPPRGDA
jgi:drug/metabolite transporter (DMT)-like permease